ncbi:carbohydrate ABC transporter permease [Paenibacillus mucilaginosus]|uniref:Sugar ABC transporter permease n=2 Tax=Paenibacillus mucilaginosus TaxID=61624 RepID=I0BSB5_9BACL|nr:carbohydrate ABC transporter permease [Paenibacillus mucilaginosus]AEI45213.1 binding-protein-dependent transport systems inner membrane component [Paenibacillus mucilaginosus KNP414]AFH65262.1 sugar ABC transporter permease [Paenibacillus mucilaginosus K02]MCG7212898.1 carbohydrate ABC transporter permease [Paenibacillus mucilaginosus]WDM26686.1 carbohydrate ABC transporter permease [Paenibacillus mucilaginosus]
METPRYTIRTFSLEIIAILLGLLFLVPFYFVIVNSFKTFADLLTDPTSLPTSLMWDNFVRAWKILKFPTVLTNSLIITVIANLAIAFLSAMAAYRMVRHPNKLNNFLFLIFVAAMVIPFQSIMIPLVRVAKTAGLFDSIFGLVVCYIGFGAPLSIFMFHGFIKSIPMEIEESAVVDGTSTYGTFFRIVLPLLKPIGVTVILLNSLWIWNDFLLPFLILQDPTLKTIPLATNTFFGQYTKQWDLALAALVLGIIPIVIFFLAMQRHIIEGITAGSVKG